MGNKSQNNELTLENISKIVDLTLSKRINKLAKVISKQTHIQLPRAVAILVYEQLQSEKNNGSVAESAADDINAEDVDGKEQ